MGFLKSLTKIITSPVTAVLGSVASTALDFATSNDAANEAQKQATANREFQAQMSNTSYQRAVADMKAAGVNPALAYSQGGASTPSGSVADTSALNQPFGSRTLQNAATAASLANTLSQTRLNDESARKLSAEADTARTVASLAQRTNGLSTVGGVVGQYSAGSAGIASTAKAINDKLIEYHRRNPVKPIPLKRSSSTPSEYVPSTASKLYQLFY